MKLKRAVIGPVLVASVAFVSGGWLMQREVTGRSGVDSRIFDEVLSRVTRDYVDAHSQDELYEMAVEGFLRELGDVLSDAGDYERATEAYAKALQSAEGKGTDAGERLADVQASPEDWQDRVGQLLRTAHEAANDEFTRAQLEARLRQFHAETWHQVPEAADAIAQGDLTRFASIVAASQRGAEAALENQISETIQLVGIARELGAVASSAFGAGFGGSVWAMVHEDEAERFASRWRDRYLKLFPQAASRMQVFETRPGAPAFESV